MKTLIPYMRQSRRKERTISIEEQRGLIESWANANGIALAPEVVEQGVSGSRSWRERALGQAVDACARGEASGIVVAWQDRLSRENGLATAEVWEALDRAGARLVAAGEGLDTATGDQEMLFTIKAAIARDQWKRHKANWEAARRRSVENSVFPGRATTGYKARKGKPLQIVPDEAAKVREAFELRDAGYSISEIGRRFGWSHSTTRQILACETYVGTIRHGGFVKENAHEAIVGRDLFDRVQAARTTQPVATGETTADRLLIGIARCSGCGRTLKVVSRKRKTDTVFSYYCKDAASIDCPSRAFVPSDKLDALIADWFEGALRTVPRMIDAVAAGQELQEAQATLDRFRRDLDAYLQLVIEDPVAFQRGLDLRQGRVREAEEQVQHLSARRSRLPMGGTLIELWGRSDSIERRQILAGFLDRVEVDRAKRGASSNLDGRVRVFWSDGTAVEIADDEDRVRVAAA